MRKITFLALALVLLLSCEKESETKTEQTSEVIGGIPEKITIDIPNSLSGETSQSKSANANDTIKGGDIYQHLRTFIFIGEKSSELVESIIKAIKLYGLNKPMDFTYKGEDGRQKHCIISENASYEGKAYTHKLNVTDSLANALTVYWSSKTIEGVAILNPYEINHKELRTGATYKLEYGEGTLSGFEKHMIISIQGWPVMGVFGLNNLKMFVGKNKDQLSIYGNSNHPNAVFFDLQKKDGFSYSFTAKADQTKNIAVVNLALPGTSVATNQNLFAEYSITKVFEKEMHAVWDPLAAGDAFKLAFIKKAIDNQLVYAQIPGYFSNGKYIGCGTSNIPVGFTSDFVNLNSLVPYIPKEIRDLKITF